jgi:DivIVA domain-containing protein
MIAIFEPEEIALKKFVIRWRGYDTREVETFLRAVAVDFRRLLDHMAAADESATTGDDLAEVRDELNRLSSRIDQALTDPDATGLTEPAGPNELSNSSDHGAPGGEASEVTDPAGEAEPRLAGVGSAGG